MMRVPAAAVRDGSVVMLRALDGTGEHEETVTRVENSAPEPGQITWHLGSGVAAVVGGALMVDVVSMPKPKGARS